MSLLPKLNYEIDINEPLRTTEFTAVQGSDFEIVVRVKRCGTIQTLEGVTPSLIVANAAEDWVRTFTGTAGGANDESIIIPVAGTALDNNGTMNYDIKLTNTDGTTPIWRRGTFIVYPSVPTGVTPTVGNPIDWSSYGTYVDTAASGPYTAGTGIAFGTADANGKVPIELDGVATLVSYDNTTSELTATNVQTAIDELDSIIDLHKQTITLTVRNETGVQIDKGSVVYISGATGNRATVALADADVANTATKTIGLAFDNIAHNSNGEIVVLGEITGVDTSGFTAGDQVWLSQTPGQPTNIRPADDAAYAYRVGYVETAANNGKILVAPQFEGTVYGETFFAATSASGVRTDLDVPSLTGGNTFDDSEQVLEKLRAINGTGINFYDQNGALKFKTGSTENISYVRILPGANETQYFGGDLYRWLRSYIRDMYTERARALDTNGIELQDSTGTTQATIDSTGLTLTADLALTEGGTGASTASGARTNLDVPSNSEVVLLAPDADTTQDVSPASGFTALRLSADGAFMVLNRTAADTEAVFNFQDEGVGTWQVGLRRDPGNTPNPAPESNAFCVIDTQDASIPFWVSLVDKMVHAVTGLVSPIVKAASASGIAFKDSTGTTQATIDSNGLDVDTLTASFGRIASVEVNAQTGTTYTLVLGDAGKVVTMSNASANTLTIPTNASVAYDVGTVINVEQIGAGSTTITASSGVTLNGVDAGSIEIGFQYGAVALRKDGTDAWVAQAAPQQSGQSATYTLLDTRTATMTGDETLTTTSAVYQFLDPDGSDRNLDLPNATMFVVKNTGDGGEVITVRDASDVTIDEVDNGVTLTFRWDGTAWQVMG